MPETTPESEPERCTCTDPDIRPIEVGYDEEAEPFVTYECRECWVHWDEAQDWEFAEVPEDE